MDRPHIRVVSAEIARDGAYLITRRRADAVLPGLWEFPGGRVREGESDAEALARCLHDRVGERPDVGGAVLEVVHDYEAYRLTLVVLAAVLRPDQNPRPVNVAEVAWVPADALGDYEFPGADQATVARLVAALD
ncbi:MAG: hypothetical protein RLZZ383_2777 [Pseudomonadota bacterium]|jgi:8-oxo-dGTP diphosphatase